MFSDYYHHFERQCQGSRERRVFSFPEGKKKRLSFAQALFR
jgi:hypothetical protein